MIVGVGIDSIEIERFKKWQEDADTTLERIFSPQEIEYCLSIPAKSAERFAVRFAAREAFYKALCMMLPEACIPFLTACKNVRIEETKGAPILHVDWHPLLNPISGADIAMGTIKSFLSLTHNKTIATALVIFER